MAQSANRHNIEPVFWRIPAPMMVLLCLLIAISAFEITWRSELASFNCILDGLAGPMSFGIFLPIFAVGSPMSLLARLGLTIGFATSFTLKPKAILFPAHFVKLGGWFNLLAFRAAFSYDVVSHNRFLQKRYWSRPLALTTSAFGLSYYTEAG